MSDSTIQFVEASEPPLKAGKRYTLRVTQQATELDAAGFPTPGGVHTYRHERTVLVQGERFSIDPSDIVSAYPPNGSIGNYASALPNITFARKTLPWEQSSGIQKAPWLALLVFHESDPGGIPPTVPAMVGDLLRAQFRPGQSLAPRPSTLVTDELSKHKVIATYADALPAWGTRPGETDWQTCMVVDIPIELFRALAPTQNELPWLAHSRVVSGGPQTGHGSTVLANRIPQVGANAAYLVSLEGMSGLLAPSSGLPANTTHVRLVVLKAWSFRHGKDLLGFHRPLSTGPLRIPLAQGQVPSETPEDAVVKNALAMGYTALDHQTRWGDRTASWYRGPLLPFSSEVTVSVPLPPICEDGYVTGAEPLASADEALRYDPVLGMLDTSYAAAWQLGRLLGLRDKTFSYDLYAWKQETKRSIFAAAAAAERARHALVPDAAPTREGAPPATPEAKAPDAVGGLFALLAEMIQPALERLASAAAEHRLPDPFGDDRADAPARRMDPKQSARELVNDRDKLQQHVDQAGVKAPHSVVDGLERLRRLVGVPIDYLVPDERMLPTESLRFFQVDLNWIYCLVEGAYSVARVSAVDRMQDAATCPHGAYRQISGFLVRSSIVSEWPGLRVQTEISNSQATFKTLRCERIAPDILLCLVEVDGPGVITSVTFELPAEQLEFHLPKAAVFRSGGRFVVDVHALAEGAGTAADFAYKLTPPVVNPSLSWNGERDVLVLAFELMDGVTQGEWQFVANGRPFGLPAPCGIATGKLECPLSERLPAGEIAVRLRPICAGAGSSPGRWVTSTKLHRPPAGPEPVLGYRVAEAQITAEWPASEENNRFEVQLIHTARHRGKSSLVGKSLIVGKLAKVAGVRRGPQPDVHASIPIGEDLVTGKVQVRWRKRSTAAGSLPGAWATSTRSFRCPRAPTEGFGQGERPSQLLFFDENYLDGHSEPGLIELFICASAGDIAHPVYTAKRSGNRVIFDVPPEHLSTPGYWIHARIVGQDDQLISSSFFSRTIT